VKLPIGGRMMADGPFAHWRSSASFALFVLATCLGIAVFLSSIIPLLYGSTNEESQIVLAFLIGLK